MEMKQSRDCFPCGRHIPGINSSPPGCNGTHESPWATLASSMWPPKWNTHVNPHRPHPTGHPYGTPLSRPAPGRHPRRRGRMSGSCSLLRSQFAFPMIPSGSADGRPAKHEAGEHPHADGQPEALYRDAPMFTRSGRLTLFLTLITCPPRPGGDASLGYSQGRSRGVSSLRPIMLGRRNMPALKISWHLGLISAVSVFAGRDRASVSE